MNQPKLLLVTCLCSLLTGCIVVPMPQAVYSGGGVDPLMTGSIYSPQPMAPLYPGDPVSRRERRLLKRLDKTHQKLARERGVGYRPQHAGGYGMPAGAGYPYGIPGIGASMPDMSGMSFGDDFGGSCGGCGDCCGADMGMMPMDGMSMGMGSPMGMESFGMGGCSSCGTGGGSPMYGMDMSPGMMMSAPPAQLHSTTPPALAPAHTPAPQPEKTQHFHGPGEAHPMPEHEVPVPMPNGNVDPAHHTQLIIPSAPNRGNFVQQTGGRVMTRQAVPYRQAP
jgi:hypothetical protein